MNITVVGAGSIGARHIRNLIALGVPAVDMTAIDFRRDALDALPLGVATVCCQPSDLLADTVGRPDALLICTPARHHQVFASYAQQHGIPFFLEKPAALSIDTLFDWDYDGPHLVACNMRFTPEYGSLASAGRRLGWFGGIELRCQSDMREWPGAHYATPVHEFCHEIDVALSVLGPATVRRVTKQPGEVEFQLQHGLFRRSTIRLSWHHAPSIRVWGVKSAVASAAVGISNQMYVWEMAHFLRVVRGEDESCNTLADAKRVVEICEQVEAAAS